MLNGALTQNSAHKFVIVVDEDIDIHDANTVNWALSWHYRSLQHDLDV